MVVLDSDHSHDHVLKELNIYSQLIGKGYYLIVGDTVDALIKASLSDEVNGEVLLAVGSRHYSVLTIANKIVDYLESGRVKTVKWPDDRQAIEVGDAVLSNKKIRAMLDWKPSTGIKAGLFRTKKYYNECLSHYISE